METFDSYPWRTVWARKERSSEEERKERDETIVWAPHVGGSKERKGAGGDRAVRFRLDSRECAGESGLNGPSTWEGNRAEEGFGPIMFGNIFCNLIYFGFEINREKLLKFQKIPQK